MMFEFLVSTTTSIVYTKMRLGEKIPTSFLFLLQSFILISNDEKVNAGMA